MYGIDEIYDMLSRSNSEKIQAEGIKIAGQVKSLNVFMRPVTQEHGKDIWENCAKVLCEKSDEMLRSGNNLNQLFEWLKDMNLPGAALIEERLHKINGKDKVSVFISSLETAVLIGDSRWAAFLAEFAKDDLGLFELLPDGYQQLVMNILTEPENDHREYLINLQKENTVKSNEKAKRDMENYIEKVGDSLSEEQKKFLRSLVQGE